ncbi:hypothetical protein HGRIS_001922 [Hohenbuehelia grisea]|uniref:TM7S3/TM198-like domain-containing protein n=1 Tax=Hohenbuehelia grisea TaxID=104357 RepID=A0ABR3JJJ0_9AGAR
MAVSPRLKTCIFLLLVQILSACASPLPYHTLSGPLSPRAGPIIRNTTGTAEVLDPNTRGFVPQGPATDGGGSANFNIPNIIWIVFSLLVGIPIAFAGIRGWRWTTGTGVGLACAVCVWAAFVNTVSAAGIPDLLLTGLTIAAFCIGFIIGLFKFGRLAGIACLGVAGGLAMGIRLILLKDNLLISAMNVFALNWVIIAFLGAAGGLTMIWWQRAGITIGSASVGTFLIGLGIDLMVNKQAGMSRGLRYLFDRNIVHIADLIGKGYKPPISAKLIMAASLLLIPALAYAQHRIFPRPFAPEDDHSDLNSLNMTGPYLDEKPSRMTRYSAWAGMKLRIGSRFST